MSERGPTSAARARMAGAAVGGFLDVARSTPTARAAAWPFPSDDERRRWFYTPTDHGGLPLSAMRPAQQRLRHAARRDRAVAGPATSRSRRSSGWRTCSTSSRAGTVEFERERGRDPGLYYLRVFGDPAPADRGRGGSAGTTSRSTTSSSTATSWRRRRASSAPIRPPSPLLGPHPLRPLAGAEDLARELVHVARRRPAGRRPCCRPSPRWTSSAANRPASPTATCRCRCRRVAARRSTASSATGCGRPRSGPSGAAGLRRRAPRRASASRTDAQGRRRRRRSTDGQRELLRALLDVYVGRIPDELADAEAAKYAGDAARRAPLRLGRRHRAGRAALLPDPGTAAARRVRQHPARRQPRALRVARPGRRFRRRRPARSLPPAPSARTLKLLCSPTTAGGVSARFRTRGVRRRAEIRGRRAGGGD